MLHAKIEVYVKTRNTISTSPAAVFLEPAKIQRNYGALPSAKLYTVICQSGRLFEAKKRKNANILLYQLNFW